MVVEFPILPEYMYLECNPQDAVDEALLTGNLQLIVGYPVLDGMDFEEVKVDFKAWLEAAYSILGPPFESILPDGVEFEINVELIGYATEFDA